MKCPHCGNEVEIEVFLLKSGSPPDPPKEMPIEELNSLIMSAGKKVLTPAERAKAYRERRKIQNKLGL